MKRLSGITAVGVLALLVVQAASAEYRVWTDTKGKTIEGELVKVVSGTVIIKPREGAELRIKESSLSLADLDYIERVTPPKIEISASKVKEDKDFYARFRRVEEENVQVKAKIRKSSSRPYSGELMAVLLVIAKSGRTDDYIIINRSMSKFSFTSENKNTHEFSSDKVRLAHSETGGDFGGEYDGYIIGVFSLDRKLIAAKSNRAQFQKNAEELLTSPKGTVFDKTGKITKQMGKGAGQLKPGQGSGPKPQRRPTPAQKKRRFFGR